MMTGMTQMIRMTGMTEMNWMTGLTDITWLTEMAKNKMTLMNGCLG